MVRTLTTENTSCMRGGYGQGWGATSTATAIPVPGSAPYKTRMEQKPALSYRKPITKTGTHTVQLESNCTVI